GQLKTDLRFELKDQKVRILQVVNGDKAWRSDNGRTLEAKGDALTHLREGLYAMQVETLLPLLTDTSYQCSSLGESKVNGGAAVGVKVARAGRKDVRIYFDKENGLLVKSERQSPEFDGKEVLRESFFSDYKPVGRVKHLQKLVAHQDGKKL